ncbi:MAG: glycosyltransferase family 4 protein [Deltaproteobacteria bacterium]|nr:glycosyltransferase family 4 protein [Deltaproteobacteria bacterium]
MKSLLLTPTFFPKATGNAVTVHRISRQLTKVKITSKIIDVSSLSRKSLLDCAQNFAPDVVHNFHAWKSGRVGLKIKEMLGIPMITTVTGTDVNVDLRDRRKREIILNVFSESDCVTVFNEQARAILLKHAVPAAKIAVIHQAVFFPRQKKREYRKLLNIAHDTAVFLLLGSIRKIKNPCYAIETLEKIRKTIPNLHVLIAGSILEWKEFRKVEALIGHKKWITYLGELPREHIRSLFHAADFLLNTSSSESESNAVMEAMNCRTIVIGKDIPGNASLLTDKTALLFHSRGDLYTKSIYALTHWDKLVEIRKKARQVVTAPPFTFAAEKESYREIYWRIGNHALR